MANETATSNIALVGLQSQLDTVRGEVISTNTNIQTIGRLIQTDNFEDQKRLIDERNQERLLAEREIRSIDEEQLRQKVDAAVTVPVRKLERKLNSSFNGIDAALKGLFNIGTGIFSTFKGIGDVGIKSLKGIGNLLKTSLGLIRSIFTTFSSGFSSVIGGIGKITSTVLGAIADLAKSPFKAIADVFKKFLPGSPKLSTAPIPTPSPGLGSLSDLFGAGIKIAGSVASGVSAVTSAKEGDVIGTGLGVLGVFNPGFALGSGVYEMLGSPGKNINMKPVQDAFSSGAESFQGFLSSVGKNFSTNGINFNSISSTFADIGKNISNSLTSSPFFQKPESQTQTKPAPQTTSGSQQLETVPFQAPPASPPPSSTPAAAPDIVYIGGNSSQQSAVVSGGDSSPTTDVPLISSSNPNNFYTLYSQVNYNVVI